MNPVVSGTAASGTAADGTVANGTAASRAAANGTAARETAGALVIASPVGALTLRSAAGALIAIEFGAAPKVGRAAPAGPVLLEAGEQLDAYFAGERREFTLPLRLAGTPFELAVWEALRHIPYGETVSYGRLAAGLGRPGAARAVGRANARNPLPIVVPCHRVIGADGRLAGYAGGLGIKRALLDLEAGASSLTAATVFVVPPSGSTPLGTAGGGVRGGLREQLVQGRQHR
jgi:methylated-DNA-[protein]-cysteine S-methyltransferase